MPKRIDPKLSRAMRDSLKAYASGNARFFDYFTPNARVYTIDDSAKPVIGRRAFQKVFGSALRRVRRKVSVVSSDIQVTGSQAVLAQTLQITSEGVTAHVRQSVVWEQDKAGEWLMSHVHNSLVGQPVVSADALGRGDPVRVVNERIATVAAAVGMAQ